MDDKLSKLTDKNKLLFAADCAEHVLKIWTGKFPDDDRPARAIQAKRDFANGLINEEEFSDASDAAWAAAGEAWAAARAAASDAALAAEQRWQNERLDYYLELQKQGEETMDNEKKSCAGCSPTHDAIDAKELCDDCVDLLEYKEQGGHNENRN